MCGAAFFVAHELVVFGLGGGGHFGWCCVVVMGCVVGVALLVCSLVGKFRGVAVVKAV